MTSPPHRPMRQAGFSMIEVLVTLVILLVGLLGLAGLMIQSQRSEMESYQRVQALILLQDIVGRINANRGVASCYAFTNNLTNGTPNLGGGAANPNLPNPMPPACGIGTNAQNLQAQNDLTAWNSLLNGAAEGGGIGAMVNGRGCVSYGGVASELLDSNGLPITGSGIYTATVAWQGLGDTAAPPASLTCGLGQYGADTRRRVASLTFRIGAINHP